MEFAKYWPRCSRAGVTSKVREVSGLERGPRKARGPSTFTAANAIRTTRTTTSNSTAFNHVFIGPPWANNRFSLSSTEKASPHSSSWSQIRTVFERVQGDMLLAVDLEEIDESGQFKKGLYFLVNADQFHLPAHLPDDAVTPRQFSQAIAIDEIDPGKIDQELLAPVAGENVDQVTKLRATIAQREPSHNIHHNDATPLSSRYLKTHSRLQCILAPGSYAWLSLLSSKDQAHSDFSSMQVSSSCGEVSPTDRSASAIISLISSRALDGSVALRQA